MIKYIKIYRILFRLNFYQLIEYRANLVNSMLGASAWAIFQIALILLLTSKAKNVLGWSKDEFLMLFLFYNIFVGIFHMLFSSNFERFASIMHHGELDSILLKPADSQFLLSSWIINFVSLTRLVIVIPFFAYLVFARNIEITLFGSLSSFLFLMVGIISVYSVWYIVTTITVWQTSLSNLTDVLYHVTGFARYPKEVYIKFSPILTYFLMPVILAVSLPVKLFLQKNQFPDLYYLLISSIALFIVSRKFWKFALRYYTSASG